MKFCTATVAVSRHAVAFILLVLLAMPRISPPAHAQSVDYGALEQLFGEPVTTSVTGKPQRAADAPANVEIITQDDIRRSGATTIPDVLRFVTGVDVREYGLANAEVGIRGYNQVADPHLMVLVDGRQVYMVDYGRIAWATIPVQLDEIRQIEVIKGPNSALYGFNAVSGVINIITYDPLHDPVNVATARAGNLDYLGGSAVGTGRIGDTAGLRVSIGGFESHDFPSGPLGPDDSESRHPPSTGTFNATGRWQVASGTQLFADASVGNTRIAQLEPSGGYDTQRLVTNSVRVGVESETRWGLLGLSAYTNQANIALEGVDEDLPRTWGEYQTTYVVQADDLVKLSPAHTLRFGLEYRENGDDSGDLMEGTISNAIYAASLMWDWQALPAVTLTNAVRVDYMRLHYSGNLLPFTGLTESQYSNTTLTAPSFNSGVVWNATQADTFRATIARGVQLPTLLQYGLQVPFGVFGPLAFFGVPDLRPSIIWNAELDYDRRLPMLDSTLRIALFDTRIDDIIAWPFGAPISLVGPGVPTSLSANVGYSTAVGTELGIKGHNQAGFRWNLSYAVTATTDHTVLNDMPPTLASWSTDTARRITW